MSRYLTNIEVDVEDVFEDLNENEKVQFLTENVETYLKIEDVAYIFGKDEMIKYVIENFHQEVVEELDLNLEE